MSSIFTLSKMSLYALKAPFGTFLCAILFFFLARASLLSFAGGNQSFSNAGIVGSYPGAFYVCFFILFFLNLFWFACFSYNELIVHIHVLCVTFVRNSEFERKMTFLFALRNCEFCYLKQCFQLLILKTKHAKKNK